MKTNHSISFFIPCYNEENNIEKALQEIDDLMIPLNYDFEVIVVEDGSKDLTKEILLNIQKKNKRLKIIFHEQNMGVGQSMIDGMMAAEKDLIFFNSADGQAPMSHLLKMLTLIDQNEADLVVGRFDARRDHPLRIFSSRTYHQFANILFGIRLSNINALKLLRRDVFDKSHIYHPALSIDLEIIYWAKHRKFKIKEVSLDHYKRWDDGGSKVINIKNIFVTFISLFKLKFKYLSLSRFN